MQRALVIVALSVGLASIASAQSAVPENVRLSDPASGFPFAEEPHVAVDSQGRVFVAWKELAGLQANGSIGFARSSDGGRTWSRSLMSRTDPAFTQGDPWLAVDERDRIFCGRLDNGLVVSRSDDGGVTWGPLVRVNDAGIPDKPSIQTDGSGVVYATYAAGAARITDWKIRVARSLDGGAAWSPTTALATGLNLFAPVIAARPDGHAWVAWQEPGTGFSNIQVAATSDRGSTWTSPVRVNPVLGTAASGLTHTPQRLAYPSAAADDRGTVFVAWSDVATGDWDAVISRSDDNGVTWAAPVRMNDVPLGDQWSVALAVDRNGVLHAGWYDTRTGKVNVYYASSSDRGATWSPNVRVTTAETEQAATRRLSEYFGLAADHNSNAYLAWTDWREGAPAIYFASLPACQAPAAPTAGNNGPIRAGQTLQLTASAVPGATYRWSGPSGFQSTLQNPTIQQATVAASGVYRVVATVAGCSSAEATTTVAVLPEPCVVGPETLCLSSIRFSVQVSWTTSSNSGRARAVSLTADTGYFWFFNLSNVELVVKLLDGRAINGRFWVFYGALSDVDYTITVTDTQTGAVKTYRNPQGRLASVADTEAF